MARLASAQADFPQMQADRLAHLERMDDRLAEILRSLDPKTRRRTSLVKKVFSLGRLITIATEIVVIHLKLLLFGEGKIIPNSFCQVLYCLFISIFT